MFIGLALGLLDRPVLEDVGFGVVVGTCVGEGEDEDELDEEVEAVEVTEETCVRSDRSEDCHRIFIAGTSPASPPPTKGGLAQSGLSLRIRDLTPSSRRYVYPRGFTIVSYFGTQNATVSPGVMLQGDPRLLV